MEKESLTGKVVRNSFWNAMMVFFAKIGGMAFAILIARFLLPEKFGIYSLAIATVMFILTLTDIGTNQTLSRYVSEALGNKDKRKASAYYKFILKLKSLFVAFSLAFLIVFAYPLSIYLFKKPDLFLPLLFSSFYLVFFSFQNFYESFFYVISNVKLLAAKEFLSQISKLILVTCFLLFFGSSVVFAIIALSASSLIALLFLLYHLRKKMDFIFAKQSEIINKQRVIFFMKRIVFSSVSLTVFSSADVIILGLFVSAIAVGYYYAALLLVAGFCGVITLSNILLPIFTQMKNEQLSGAFDKLLRYLSLISMPVIFGIFALGKYLLRIVYGYEYLGATIPLIILSIMIFELPITENLKAILFSKEKPAQVMKIMIFATLMNITLNFIFIYLLLQISEILAITGAAIATIISRMTVLFVLVVITKRELNISVKIIHVFRPLVASSLMLFCLLFLNKYYFTDMTFFIGAFEVLLGAGIYLLFMIFMKGIKKEDLVLVKKLFRR